MEKRKTEYLNSVNLNNDTSFPYLVLDVINDNAFPRNPGFQVMHWHEDLQFIYVIDGGITVKTLDTEININQDSDSVHLFENAIDLLSYATLEKLAGQDWRQDNLVSLSGVYLPKEKVEDSTMPQIHSED